MHDLISWASHEHDVVALFSTKSEFIAAETCRELLWLEKLLNSFGRKGEMPFQVMEDNQNYIKQSQSEKMKAPTKHIGLRCPLVCDLTKKGIVEVIYCHTTEMRANILIKLLYRDCFQNLNSKAGLLKGHSMQVSKAVLHAVCSLNDWGTLLAW
ncbi:hypothetical protein JRQ81_002282, partial [Phrynocephalus forsythii]